ncbi:MAG TPA: hypothetical protein VJX74_01185, partial [Blastocatellia bacterium]|nr:hypothetical protein [Blastocatellia bacterium]
YVNFEGSQTSPVRLSPDGSRLFAINTPDARLSVFDISQSSGPALIAEIPVGIEPVSVNPRSNDEVWVVGHGFVGLESRRPRRHGDDSQFADRHVTVSPDERADDHANAQRA